MDGEPAAKKAKLQANDQGDRSFVCDANEVLKFHILDPRAEPTAIEGEETFAPAMCHQIAGDEEEIKGYGALAIDLWLSQRSYQALVEVRYEAKQPGAVSIVKLLRDKFPAGLAESRTAYITALKSTPPLSVDSLGDPISTRSMEDGSGLAVYRTSLSQAHQTVKDLHSRFQPLLLFFVDGANFIDPKEPEWDLLLAVRVLGDIVTVVGLATVYRFYCYPDRTRLRVSQVLVLPPHQGKGVGRALLEAVYAVADSSNALDITYEDPTDNVQAMRERLELQRALKLPWLTELADATARTTTLAAPPAANETAQENGAASMDASAIALSAEDQARAQVELRVSKQQVRKLWEVLLSARPQLQGAAGAGLLRTLVQARLVSSVTSTKRVAEGKRIIDFGQDVGFMMAKVPRTAGLSAGMPIALEGEDAAGESAEAREAALSEAVDKRMEELKLLVAFLQRQP